MQPSHEVLREAFEKVSPKEIASELGVSLSLVYKWAQPPEEGAGGGSRNPLDRALDLLRLIDDPRAINWLCHMMGGFFVHNKHAAEEYEEIAPATNEILQQFADLLESITEAAVDRSINIDESRRIRRHWEHLKSYTEGFVRACEMGDFENMQMRKKQT